jgi:hypothetical protein
MTTLRPISKLFVAALLLCAAVAQADVLNGDFESGGTGWQVAVPTNWQTAFPAAGGNPGGYGAIQSPFGGAGGTGCIMQTFVCGNVGEEGTCTITLDYSLLQIDASDFSGRIVIRIDGVAYTFAPNDSGWHSATFTVPCGVHVLELCLQVDPQNNGWRACFDNVEASCDGIVPSESTNWSTIKALYN